MMFPSRALSRAIMGAGLVLATVPALAIEEGDVIVRVGATSVQPAESSSVITTAATGPLAGTGLSLDDSWGLSTRAGVDWELGNDWLVNASLWRIDIDTTATLGSALGRVRADVDLDPWVCMVSVGYKF
jgi:outer membrane protein W